MVRLRSENQQSSQDDKSLANDAYQQFLTFLLGNQVLGIDILEIKEIIETTRITRIPKTPAYIRGVINLRGNIVPVIDLSARLYQYASELSKLSCIVLVEVELNHEMHMVGALIDQVNEILDIAEADLLPAPDFGTEIRIDFIKAMGKVNNEFITLLAIERILSIIELAEFQSITQENNQQFQTSEVSK
ncbi:chemotaxis protein CheW [Methylocucumis oryzae]|uniref:Chemotaxis protein CheW n=1 Tax=Methylocucumis oryzae TaxID=1632867 RepID=A0A0F3IKI2_9GAMM|nr:chemotaxis protein CheW [Methylocucumis oryzae]KJV07221.1 chemotaxis protein CheW [Methylocucumis oryzae]